MAQVLFNGKTKEREDLLTVSCGFVKEHSAQREEALLENGECGGAAREPPLSNTATTPPQEHEAPKGQEGRAAA